MDHLLPIAIASALLAFVPLVRKARQIRKAGFWNWVDCSSDFEVAGVVLFTLLFVAASATSWVALTGFLGQGS